jgi:hypothetical protein
MGNFRFKCSDCTNYKEKEFLIVDDKRPTSQISQRNSQIIIQSNPLQNGRTAKLP